jgi:hypothetical protein
MIVIPTIRKMQYLLVTGLGVETVEIALDGVAL